MSSPPLREYPKVLMLLGPSSDPLITCIGGDRGGSHHHPLDSGVPPLHPSLELGVLGGVLGRDPGPAPSPRAPWGPLTCRGRSCSPSALLW